VTALNKEPAMKVKVDNGDKREFTVMVNGQIVARKNGEVAHDRGSCGRGPRESLAGHVV
jgi:hypothetical protein